MKQLHPGAKWLFRVTTYFSTILLVLLSLAIYPIYTTITSLTGAPWYVILEIHLSIGLALAVICSEIYVRLSYNNWFYEFGDDGLRLERGIIWKAYTNIPYERIQNIDIRRGITARIFGFSSLYLQTAGYSGLGYSGRGLIPALLALQQSESEGYIPAISVEEAERLRSFVMKKISSKRK